MVKLVCKDSPNVDFYFHNMDDCKEFLRVFENRWVNIEWEEPEVADDFKIDKYTRDLMDMNQKKRAEENLSWGFSLAKSLGRGLTEEQTRFVKAMMEYTETGEVTPDMEYFMKKYNV